VAARALVVMPASCPSTKQIVAFVWRVFRR
jgi:hypothetical protein